MKAIKPRTSLSAPVAQLPVAQVERAQRYSRDTLGFEINGLEPDKGIGAVLLQPIGKWIRAARRSPSRSSGSLGACDSSRSRISTETASTSTANSVRMRR